MIRQSRLRSLARASTSAEASADRSARRGVLPRVARVAYAFVLMNYAAVAGLLAAVTGRRIWR
jgi:hypothetical protein